MQKDLNIIVIDDNPDITALYAAVLGANGFNRTALCNDAVSLLTILPYINPDVIISDIDMPKMNGLELYKRIRNNKIYKTVKFIVTSANKKGHTKWLIQTDGFFKKPVDFKELTALLDSFLSEKPPKEKRFCTRLDTHPLIRLKENPELFHTVRNVSLSGTCFESWKEYEEDSRVNIPVSRPGTDKSGEVPAKIIWKKESEKGFAYGLKFASAFDPGSGLTFVQT